MDFDDIVIGSGLAALGTVLGLERSARVLVVCGPERGGFSYYDSRRAVPCAYSGAGGLGNDWHGVIPTGWRNNFAASSDAEFAGTFNKFYPHTPIGERLGTPALFVPWRPIRPRAELLRLARSRGPRLTLSWQAALGLEPRGAHACVRTAQGIHSARRVWLAAGALGTPELLESALGPGFRRPVVSDHVFCYLGHVDGVAAPDIVHSRDGMLMPAQYGAGNAALYTLRPARFAFRQLDHGIEQRAVFGLPTGNAIAKIARRLSAGLLAEALFNRFGAFASARRYSVYAQVLVQDAYGWQPAAEPALCARTGVIREATDAARSEVPIHGVHASRRPEMHIPGIHLHHSVDLDALKRAGINTPGSPVQIVDASVLNDIGCEHHSFKMLIAARERARRAVADTACDTVPSTRGAPAQSGRRTTA